MGLDYSYMLFFKRQDPWRLLEHVAGIANHNLENHTAVLFPDRIMRLPFEAWAGTENRIDWDDPSPTWNFMSSLYFEPDEALTNYAERQEDAFREKSGKRDWSIPRDHLGRVAIGYIYLTLYNDLRELSDEMHEPNLIMLRFDTPGTSMSLLFSECGSIRRQMIQFLEQNRGIYGLLDREEEAQLFWFKGGERDVILPHAYMTLAEIEKFLEGE